MKQSERKQNQRLLGLAFVAILAVTSCTKKRGAELSEGDQETVWAISEFGTPAESLFSASREDVESSNMQDSLHALDTSASSKLSADEVDVPARMKFMFDRLPIIGQSVKNFKITFSVDKESVTAYKVADSISELTALEKSIAISVREAQLLSEVSKVVAAADIKKVKNDQAAAKALADAIRSGKSQGRLLVPLFKYKVLQVGILKKDKNDLKEETSRLSLKETDFKNATHIQISNLTEEREIVGLVDSQSQMMKELYQTSKLDNQVTVAGELADRLKIGLKFLPADQKVLTKINGNDLLIYNVTTISTLTEAQLRALTNNASNGTIKRCSDEDVVAAVASKDPNCVLIVTASLQIEHVKPVLSETDAQTGATSADIDLKEATASEGTGIARIREKTAATQEEIVNGILDPNSTLKLADLQGEFFFRRTLEDAASSFIGRTGTSGDMTLVKFELEDDRLVVRNVLSLIQYTGQGAKDKEEVLSIPVVYLRAIKETANGTKLAVPRYVETSKEKAEVVKLDWTRNSIPDASSPLAFYDAGSCFISNSGEKIVATDMRLATDGVLNFSIASSHSVDTSCAAFKDVNHYWSSMPQFNFNVQERISFKRHTNATGTDTQFAMNISPMAQEAFNFGVFTLADKVTENGTLGNRDGSEKYMPMIHDLRNGRVMKWYLGGINNPQATNPERRQLLVDAAKQVVAEWNASFRMSMKGTPLERSGDYIELIIEEPGQETGRLGDLDRNYIWFNEIPSENGLLGVAQPAGNPRSGVVESANAIVYTGNTFEYTQALLKATKLSRQYEQLIEEVKNQAVKQAQAQDEAVSTAEMEAEQQQAAKEAAGVKVSAQAKALKGKTKLNERNLKQIISALDLDKKTFANALKQLDVKLAPGQSNLPKISRDMFKGTRKGQKIDYKVDSRTFTHKLTELAMDKSLQQNPRELEFKMNEVFLVHAGLSEATKTALNKRQAQLALMIRFDKSQLHRPGCFSYTRTEIEDNALNADPDPKKNLMINFKQAVMSTLSHELGHAFGLQHNFMGSTDKANYEFPGEETHRNYSSIMDYMPDIEQHYAGPGPYDVHAIRAAYTGYVNLNPELLKNAQVMNQLKTNKINLVEGATGIMISITDAARVLGKNSFVHLAKDTINPTGLLEYYAQCNDMGVGASIMCSRFDNGGSPQEIVANKIADYTRAYANRFYVFDRISFSWPQKVQAILRNIQLFEEIRGFLDETLIAAIYGSGLGEQKDEAHLYDLIDATVEGYKFFHEVVRIPDANTSLMDINKRFHAIPYTYGVVKRDDQGKPILDGEGKPVIEQKKDIKVLEARAIYDVALSRDKIDTIGIGYDKMFAMNFLLLASEMSGTDDSQMNMISYTDFEQFFLGVKDPAESMTIQTSLDILTGNLSAGFHAPNGEFVPVNMPVEANRLLADQTAIAAVIGMNQAKWSSYDKFAESLLIARSTVKQAPKDRINVIRMGQDRSKQDTSVYFAGQNSMAANSIIMQAARPEVLLAAKADLFTSLKAMSEADAKVKGPIAAVKDKACEIDETTAEPKDPVGCEAALVKSDEDYVKEMPALAQAKAKADAEAKKLVNKLRQLNGKGVIMPKELDAADSKVNFQNQVELVRERLFIDLSTIHDSLRMLAETPMAELQGTIQFVLQNLQRSKQENEQLSALPIMAVAQMFMTESTAELKITLQDGQSEITGAIISGLMMNGKKLEQDQAKLTDVIDQLSIFSRYVDPDLGITK